MNAQADFLSNGTICDSVTLNKIIKAVRELPRWIKNVKTMSDEEIITALYDESITFRQISTLVEDMPKEFYEIAGPCTTAIGDHERLISYDE